MSWWQSPEEWNGSWRSKQADRSAFRGQQKSLSATTWQDDREHGQWRDGSKHWDSSQSGAAFPNHDSEWKSGQWRHESKQWDSSRSGAAWAAVKGKGAFKGTGKGAVKGKGKVAAALAALPGPSSPGGASGMDPGRQAPKTENLDGFGGMPNFSASSQFAPQTQTQDGFIEQVSKTSIPEGRIYWIRNGKSQWEPPPFERLVDPWQKHKKKDGTIFYYNRLTKKTLLERPPPFQAPGTPPQQQERQTVKEKQSEKEKSKATEKETKKDRKERKEKGNATKQKETQTAPKNAKEKKEQRKTDVQKAQSDRARTGRKEVKKKVTKKKQEDAEEGDPKLAAPVTPSAGSSSGRQQEAPSETPPKWLAKARTRKRRRLPQVLATSPHAPEMEILQLTFAMKLESGELSRTLDDAKVPYSSNTAKTYCRSLELLNQEFGGQLLDKVRSSLESPVLLIEEVQKLDVVHGHVALALFIDFMRRQPPLTAEEESRKRRFLAEREKEMELDAVLSKFAAKLENGEIKGKRVGKYSKSSARTYSTVLRTLNQECGETLLSKVRSSLDASELQEYFKSFDPSPQHWAVSLSLFVDFMKNE